VQQSGRFLPLRAGSPQWQWRPRTPAVAATTAARIRAFPRFSAESADSCRKAYFIAQTELRRRMELRDGKSIKFLMRQTQKC
jgi:hypothetical protein